MIMGDYYRFNVDSPCAEASSGSSQSSCEARPYEKGQKFQIREAGE